MKPPITRKQESEKILKNLGIPFIEHLPCIEAENEITLRGENEILERIIAIAATFGKATSASKEDLEDFFNLHNPIKFSKEEKTFIENENNNEKQSINFSWKIECAWVLFWSLGLLEELNYPDDTCDVDFILEKLVYKTKDEIKSQIKMRSKTEILDYLDLTYRMHWAARNALLKQEQIPGNIDYGVIFERHYALNWLTNYMNLDWDEISTDT